LLLLLLLPLLYSTATLALPVGTSIHISKQWEQRGQRFHEEGGQWADR
jgi:hypothetical protein